MVAGALESRQWSASTLANGLGTVMADVKLEPWTDGDDDADLLRQLKDPIIRGTRGHILIISNYTLRPIVLSLR